MVESNSIQSINPYFNIGEGYQGEGIPIHQVRPDIKRACGIDEDEPVALLVHICTPEVAVSISKYGFVNVAGRGTFANAFDLDRPEEYGPALIASSKATGTGIGMVTFCVPTRLLEADRSKRYGLSSTLTLPKEGPQELWDIYNKIAVEYDDQTGEPIRFARDDQNLHPVWLPPSSVIGYVATPPKT